MAHQEVDGVDIIPGTEVMRDDEKVNKCLVPKPSDDPADPLNWSVGWKCKSQTRFASRPAANFNSSSDGCYQPMAVYLDIRHWRSIHCADVSFAGTRIPFE